MTIKEFLTACGWHKGVGANFYMPAAHPHVHLILDGIGLETGDVGDNVTHANKLKAYKNFKAKIRTVAISDGNRGINLISDGKETKDIKNALNIIIRVGGESDNSEKMKGELFYILQAFDFGF